MGKFFGRVIRMLVVKTKIVELLVSFNLTYAMSRIVISVSTFINVNSPYTVLCFGRPIFDEDINALSGFSSRINYVIIPKFLMLSIFKCFLSDILRPGIHIKYHEINGFSEDKLEYRRYMDTLFNRLLLSIPFDAVLSGNYVYAWQQEVAKNCLDRGIPFIVLYKEGLTTNGNDISYMTRYTNNNFIGTKLLVYNKRIEQAILKLQVKNLNEDNVESIGIPRLDRYFKIKSKGKSLVFFSFYIEDKIRHLELSEDIIGQYVEDAKNFHIEVMKFAVRNSNINVIIKTKSSEIYYNYVYDIAKSMNVDGIDNLVITSEGEAYDFIKDSLCVIGYNSTVLLEGVIANRIIITPDFDSNVVDDFFKNYRELVNYARTRSDIEKYIYNDNYPSNKKHIRQKFIKNFSSISDGSVSLKVEKSIIRTIQNI